MNARLLARRVGALFALAALGVAAWTVVLQPLRRAAEDAFESLHRARLELARLHERSALGRSLSDDVVAGHGRAVAALVFPAPNRFISSVEEAVRASGVQLEQLRMAAASPPGGELARQAADLSLSGTEAQLRAFMKHVAAHRPLIAVERMVLASRPSQEAGAPELSMEFRLAGFIRSVDAATRGEEPR